MAASRFVAGAALAAALILLVSGFVAMPLWLLAAEVFATILGLFVFGSFAYQIHKNALTFGMLLVIVATFAGLRTSTWHLEIAEQGTWAWIRHHVLSFSGLDDLVHADTMLFILGLTLFVAVVAQTRLLEGLTFVLLRRNRGRLLPTVVAITAVVAVASGVLDGVSMIGLTIRTLVIILMLAAAPVAAVRYAVMVCTVVTTICGIWLAYGEPPNLIMRANLAPHLDSLFFLRYCLPAAIVSYAVIAWQLRGKLGGQQIDLVNMDVIDANIEDVRFLQASRQGEVMTPIELVEGHAPDLAGRAPAVIERLRTGEPLGLAMIRADVSEPARRQLLAHFVSAELADGLDTHYVLDNAEQYEAAFRAELAVDDVLAATSVVRRRAQRIGAVAVVPFVLLLAAHSWNHRIPLFAASFAAFLAALPAIFTIPNMHRLALREASQEYAEYFFLFPLFLSITLLTSAGFFDEMHRVITAGMAAIGRANMAVAQFYGCTVLSAILDNNIVADFASRGLRGLEVSVLKLFAMAQIAGYALGGCWTHIGCAQSVVAYAFIQRDIDEHYTPIQWIRDMSPVIVTTLVALTALIYLESLVF
jgi:Na+/H+ antiporter NhaD/arsenite permease-like protein